MTNLKWQMKKRINNESFEWFRHSCFDIDLSFGFRYSSFDLTNLNELTQQKSWQ